ncbi:MAG TPA: isoleucine--tRNA ligase [Armatimonadota bacterium]|nr:isoleucine--tRNA ligase [Armatimonadota bacterium]
MNYSETLNLPKTDFPMRAELSKREPEIERYWEEIGLYQKSLEKPARGDFILHDGPPYSNGNIHIGHALNKVLKDFVVKYKTMAGFRCAYVPGWDNHGMPIEVEVQREFRRAGRKLDRLQLRRRCREYAADWVAVQREEFKRLGVRGDWDSPYLTMSTEYEAMIIKVFAELALAGYVYRGLKPIFWCPICETALAEAEIEYAPHVSPSIYARFPLKSDPKGVFAGLPAESVSALIWTTTPWTIPANVALAVHPNYKYVVVETGGAYYLLAEDLIEQVLRAIGVSDYKVIRTIKGSELEGAIFAHPIYERDSVVVLADYVTLTEGTGIVHTAPGHGREDFQTGQEYGLPTLNPVDASGRFTAEAGQFEGLTVEEGNRAVVEELERRGHLLAHTSVEHSYPHCWRCRGPVIFRAAVQWFLNMDHENLRQRILDAIGTVAWYPPESINRITSMIAGSPDWCLSRQRTWGVGIPVFYCRGCEKEIMTRESLDAVYALVRAEGSDAWFTKEPSEILPQGFKCPKCGGAEFTKETDILDVWFDSGSSCRAVLETKPELRYPADIYLEGSDQHRGWFNKSLVVGVATKGDSPFRQCVTNGWMLDEHGRTMHKSWGNVIAPQEIIKKDGADALRLWVSSTDYFEDVRLGEEILKRVGDAYRRIRNTFRFLLANLYDFDPSSDCAAYGKMLEIDRWALHRLQTLIRDVTQAYEGYEFHKVYHSVHNFCAADLSAFYLDVLKDRLYTSAPKSVQRRSAQTALWELLSAIVRMMAPILSYTAEEVWRYMPADGREVSVQLAEFPKVNDAYVDEELSARWEKLLDVREEVYRHIEEARTTGVIAKPLEALVVLTAASPLYDLLHAYQDQLASVLIVSQVRLEKAEAGAALQVCVEPAEGTKCARCWLVLPAVGQHAVHPSLCARCAEVVTEVY